MKVSTAKAKKIPPEERCQYFIIQPAIKQRGTAKVCHTRVCRARATRFYYFPDANQAHGEDEYERRCDVHALDLRAIREIAKIAVYKITKAIYLVGRIMES